MQFLVTVEVEPIHPNVKLQTNLPEIIANRISEMILSGLNGDVTNNERVYTLALLDVLPHPNTP